MPCFFMKMGWQSFLHAKMNRNIHRCTFWTNQLWQFSVGSLIIGFSGVFPKLASHLPQWSLLFHYCSHFLPYSLSLGICNYICIFTFQNCLDILTIFLLFFQDRPFTKKICFWNLILLDNINFSSFKKNILFELVYGGSFIDVAYPV